MLLVKIATLKWLRSSEYLCMLCVVVLVQGEGEGGLGPGVAASC